jgi:hypothetical protein
MFHQTDIIFNEWEYKIQINILRRNDLILINSKLPKFYIKAKNYFMINIKTNNLIINTK